MKTEIIYSVQTGGVKITFCNEYDEDGYCTDAYSFNPTSGWTGFTQFGQNWSYEDENKNASLNAIRDFVTSMECEELISSIEKEDIGEKYSVTYYCDRYVENNSNWDFIITIDDVEEFERKEE